MEQKFCSQCGQSLWKNCLECGATVAASEVYCGSCGRSWRESLTRRVAIVDEAISRAHAAEHDGDLDSAISALAGLADSPVPEIQAKIASARTLAESLRVRREEILRDRDQAEGEAAHWIREGKYKEAIGRLQSVPQRFRGASLQSLLTTTEATYREIQSLRSAIATGVESRKLMHLAPHLDRYLALRREDTKITTLAHRVRDHVVEKVREAIRESEYERAVQLLDSLPRSAMNDDSRQFEALTRDILRLHTTLRNAVHVDRGLLTIAEHLATLTPHDSQLPPLIEKIKRRLARGPGNTRSPLIPWSPLPQHPYLGVHVSWVTRGSRPLSPDPTIDGEFGQQAGVYFAALGLALRGISKAPIQLNLAPQREAGGLLRKLAALRKPVYKRAWGLDVGRHALKAVCLAPGVSPDAPPQVLACDYLPHRMNLASPEGDSRRFELARETVAKWKELRQPQPDDAICVSLPSSRLLGKFFQLPAAKEAKLAELVAFEVGQQVPYPLAELAWSFESLSKSEGVEAVGDSGGLRPVMVAAMRINDVNDVLQPFTELNLSVQFAQPIPVALFNAFSFEGLLDRSAAGKVGEPASGDAENHCGILDIGSESSNLVVGSATQFWFRTFRFGGNDYTQNLSRKLKLTFSQAEMSKRDLTIPDRVGEALELLNETHGRLLSEVQRSLETYRQDHPQASLRLVWLCGGAAAQHGLLQSLVAGQRR